ncbi:MAG: Sjogren's syndrome/scleroderma autoantigen 1 family protein [Euryarchaeota archaeon]|nr:Sjogren's syndrome/scleroderma autoantigen 1 family protein [Euryarchaeota archaeon]
MNEIDAMSRLLELGGTMLADHCSRCGAPLFRYQGRIGCPVCDFTMKQKEEIKEKKERKETAASPFRDIISEKIGEIASDMQKETDLGRIRDQMDCIERGIRILGMLDSN